MTQETDESQRRPRLPMANPLMIRLDEGGDVKPAEHAAKLIDLSCGGLRCSGNLPDVPIGTDVVVTLKIPLWVVRWPLRLPGTVVGVVAEESQWVIEFRDLQGWRMGQLQAYLRRIQAAAQALRAAHGGRSQLAEAFRMIQVGLEPFGGERARVILVTSATFGEGRSFVACGLAAILARAGYRVLLVDADLDQPSLHEVFRVNPAPGVAHLLTGNQRFDLADLVQKTRSGISVLPAGNDGTQTDLHSAHSATRFVDILRKSDYQFVIVDSPPLLMRASATQLASAADDVLLTVRSGRSREREVQHAKTLLDRQGAKLRGVVLNDSTLALHDYFAGLPLETTEFDVSSIQATKPALDKLAEASPSSSSVEVRAAPKP